MRVKVAGQTDRPLELEVTEADVADWYARQREDSPWWTWLVRKLTKNDAASAGESLSPPR